MQRQKKVGILVGLFAFVVTSFATTSAAQAAACSNTSNFGVATMSVNIPATGEYRLWSRIKIPSGSSNTYQLEADGNTCWQVGGSKVPVNTWTWVDWYGGNSSQKVNYTFTTTGNHTLKLIGSATNVQIDKVVLLGTGEQCSDGSQAPSGDGSNCSSAPAGNNTGGGSAGGASPTPEDTPVTGSTTPAIVQQNQANTAQTEYSIDGKVVQVSTGAAALDTSKLADGTYELKTELTLNDGTKVSDTQQIVVKNGKSLVQKIRVPLFILLGILCTGLILFAVAWLFFRGKLDRVVSLFSKPHAETPVSQQLPGANVDDPVVIKPSNQK